MWLTGKVTQLDTMVEFLKHETRCVAHELCAMHVDRSTCPMQFCTSSHVYRNLDVMNANASGHLAATGAYAGSSS